MFPSFDFRCCQIVHLIRLVIGYISAFSSVVLLCAAPVSDQIFAYLVPALILVCVGTGVVGLAVGYNAALPGRLNMALAMLLLFVSSIAVAYLFKPEPMMIQVPLFFVAGFVDGANLGRGLMLVLIVIRFAAAGCCLTILGTSIAINAIAASLLAEATGSISGLVFRARDQTVGPRNSLVTKTRDD